MGEIVNGNSQNVPEVLNVRVNENKKKLLFLGFFFKQWKTFEKENVIFL